MPLFCYAYDMDSEKELCAKLLEGFEVTENVDPDELRNFRTGQSQLYAKGSLYIFNYKKKRYVMNDYSIGDDPKFAKNILLDSNHLPKGNIVKSPVAFTSEGAEYI